MAISRRRARDAAQWEGTSKLYLDHATLVDDDLEWVSGVRDLTLWNVKLSPGLLSQIPLLERLAIRGGAGVNAEFIDGCTGLRAVEINQVRGLTDLSAISRAVGLRALLLYGLPQVRQLPSMRELGQLEVVELGSMKNLHDVDGLLDNGALQELRFVRAMGVGPEVADAIAAHRSIERFGWFAEDVPDRVWAPFVERVGKNPVNWGTWVV